MNKEKKTINSVDYQEKFNREGNISAWLDEALEDVLNVLKDTLNESNTETREIKLKSLISYLNGLQDGNRFGKKNPYNKNCLQLIEKNGTRILS